ncbi:hypothetical protein [Faecalibacter sp. LW9]|uniref:hypothetical protein n=1 Tax=Faecalibacter sp. LW9 TaxID=3103144 RepID=UPI002AFF39A5|nr:hypothetical protein [Faecalibacter sp. LW9]
MIWNKMKASAAYVMAYLGLEEIPVKEGKVDFKEDQRTKIEEKLGAEQAQKLFDNMNAELASNEVNAKEQAALDAVLKELEVDMSSEQGAEQASTEEKQTLATEGIKKLKADNEKMAKESVGDKPMSVIRKAAAPLAVVAGMMLPAHSATHIFGSNESWNAFENRPWNERMKSRSPKASTFGSEEIPLLEKDAEHFIRQNPKVLESFLFDKGELPKEWGYQSGVVEMITNAGISVGEIVQARKKGWAPKNKFIISVEAGYVYPKKIDIEFEGYQLQMYETMWIREVVNLDGSHPWKMSFIGYLLSKLIEQQRIDDRKAQINGILAIDPREDVPGAAINSQDGLRFLYWKARDVEKKYRPFVTGELTPENTFDKIQWMIEQLPDEVRSAEGLEIQLSQKVLKWYKDGAGDLYDRKLSQDEGRKAYAKNHPVDYPNIIFQPLVDFTNTTFVAITYSKNIEVLEFDPSEKGKFTMGHDKRNTWIFADYRLGIRIKRVGLKLAVDHPDKYIAQEVWTNDVPIFDKSVKVPVFDDNSGIVKLKYDNMQIADNFVTDITKIEGATPGHIINITGNKALASSSVALKDGENLDLTADFILKTEGTITLFVKPDGTLKELMRTDEAEKLVDNEVAYAQAVLDADTAEVFRYEGSEALTITEVIKGVEGKEITIYGGAGAVTVAQTGNIELASALTLEDATKFVKLVHYSGKWYETARG